MANVLINGGSRGVGRGICEAFINNGDNVFFTCKNEKSLQNSLEILQQGAKESQVFGTICDSRDYLQVKNTIDMVYREMKGIDILVNNAGIRTYGTIEEIEVEDWINAVETNINGYFYFTKYSMPYLLKSKRAWIFNIGSTAGINAFSGGISYNTTKAAIHGFSASLELDVRSKGIRVCNVIPGNVYIKEDECRLDDEWMLKPIDIGNSIIAQTKLDKNCLISSLVIKPTKSPQHPSKGIQALRYV